MLTDKEVVEEILRSNHLAKKTIKEMASGLNQQPGDYLYQDLETMHSEHFDSILSKMPESEFRTRPSLLSEFAPAIFKCISVVNTRIWGQDRAKRVIAGMEKGIQNEQDE